MFFKWIKQNLKIKRFLGTFEQAVHLQVLIAIIIYLLHKLVNNSLSTLQVSLQQPNPAHLSQCIPAKIGD